MLAFEKHLPNSMCDTSELRTENGKWSFSFIAPDVSSYLAVSCFALSSVGSLSHLKKRLNLSVLSPCDGSNDQKSTPQPVSRKGFNLMSLRESAHYAHVGPRAQLSRCWGLTGENRLLTSKTHIKTQNTLLFEQVSALFIPWTTGSLLACCQK